MDPTPQTADEQNAATLAAWNANAAFWSSKMGEGNLWHRELLEPTILDLLGDVRGLTIIDAACGNGQLARRLSERGAKVTAFDFAPAMIEEARSRSAGFSIAHQIADATSRADLDALGLETADAVVCGMGLMDIANIAPLLAFSFDLLRPRGVFVFSVQHPCFNSRYVTLIAEQGVIEARHALRIEGYKSAAPAWGEAIRGQPELQLYFHRSQEELFGAFFAAGFVMNGLREPSFDPSDKPTNQPSFQNLDIPPVLVVRMKKPA
jgi:2-polyprenyl-3-methyl-5-hydroxy-6-metoxy-1,4-benzoquinol methylase